MRYYQNKTNVKKTIDSSMKDLKQLLVNANNVDVNMYFK